MTIYLPGVLMVVFGVILAASWLIIATQPQLTTKGIAFIWMMSSAVWSVFVVNRFIIYCNEVLLCSVSKDQYEEDSTSSGDNVDYSSSEAETEDYSEDLASPLSSDDDDDDCPQDLESEDNYDGDDGNTVEWEILGEHIPTTDKDLPGFDLCAAVPVSIPSGESGIVQTLIGVKSMPVSTHLMITGTPDQTYPNLVVFQQFLRTDQTSPITIPVMNTTNKNLAVLAGDIIGQIVFVRPHKPITIVTFRK